MASTLLQRAGKAGRMRPAGVVRGTGLMVVEAQQPVAAE